MTAYVIVEVDVTDPDAYEVYKPLAAAAVEAHGGRYIARGGATELLEGDLEPTRIVLLEFPDATAAHAWYHSPEYGKAKDARAGAATGRFVVVEGVG
jgi:uncharacterized protein (DUF1330 family)